MTGYKLRTSGVERDRSTDCATTTIIIFQANLMQLSLNSLSGKLTRLTARICHNREFQICGNQRAKGLRHAISLNVYKTEQKEIKCQIKSIFDS